MFFRKPLNQLRYPVEGGRAVIEIKVKTFHHLFDQRDPAPFRDKDLDEDAAEYILMCAQEISSERVGKLRIFYDEETGVDNVEAVRVGVRSYFELQYQLGSKKLGAIFSIGFKSLLIGLVLLTMAVLTLIYLETSNGQFLSLFLQQNLLLLGWVAMWKPINVFLYDWWPIVDILKIYRRLSEVPIEVIHLRS